MNNFSKGLTGDYKLPTWAAVLILILALLGVGVYYGFKEYWRSQGEQRGLLTAQQEKLALARQEIAALKGEASSTKAEVILASQPESVLAKIIREWRPRTASVKCTYNDDPDNPDKGSGLWLSSENVVITSRHVVERAEVGGGVRPDSCSVKLPGDKEVTVEGGDIRDWHGQRSVTALFIANPTNVMKSTRSSLASVCASRGSVGERVAALGYPRIGSETDITVTEGIIAGYDEKDGDKFHITSAKIDKGNSGGPTISIDRSCYLGMPVFVRLGEIESLGRILDFQSLIR